MVNFDEFSAWVEVDGVRSEEFNTYICKNEQKVSTVTCWIPSEKGKVRSDMYRYVQHLHPL